LSKKAIQKSIKKMEGNGANAHKKWYFKHYMKPKFKSIAAKIKNCRNTNTSIIIAFVLGMLVLEKCSCI